MPSREEIDSLDRPGYEVLREADPDWEVYYHPNRCPTLLIQLELGFMMWGDGGSGQLFGDPAALARGDLSSLWWDWACS